MSQDFFVQFIDRAAVDPMLRLSWREYQKRYNVTKEEIECLQAHLPEEPTEDEMMEILDKKSVLWTVKHSWPHLICLNGTIDSARSIKKQCPSVSAYDLPDQNAICLTVLFSAAMHGFLSKRIDSRTLHAVAVISLIGCDCLTLKNFLNLSRKHKAIIVNALKPLFGLRSSIFSWQEITVEEYNNGHITCLGLVDTKRFLRFFTKAWDENWTVPYDIDWDVHSSPGHFRDYEITKRLVKIVKARRFERPCMISGYE